MRNIMDWVIDKMRLTDPEDDMEILPSDETKGIQTPEGKDQVYYKAIQSYENCKEVIDRYKSGAACIFSFDPTKVMDAQGMMNYICGGIYALNGEIDSLSQNTYLAYEKRAKIWHSDKKI